MPNWCFNNLRVTGNPREMKEFKSQAPGENEHGDKFDFRISSFFPTPQHKMEGHAWYQWRNANWGCKWDVEGHLTEEYPDSLLFEFDSPWDTPNEAIRKISEMFPGLDFCLTYEEPAMSVSGVYEFNRGTECGGDDSVFQDRLCMCEED